MQANSWHHKLFHFESGKCGKKGKILQKSEYREHERSFLDEIKSLFDSFWGTAIWGKTKIADTNFNINQRALLI